MKIQTPMKLPLVLFASLFSFSAAYASEGHDHADHAHSHAAEKVMVSPNGGRIVTAVEPHFEFSLQEGRIAQITFIDDSGKTLAVSGQQIYLVGGSRSAPVRIDFIQQGDVLVSERALPAIENMPIVLQIKTAPEAKAVREKFYLNLSNCSSCSFQEYACICGH